MPRKPWEIRHTRDVISDVILNIATTIGLGLGLGWITILMTSSVTTPTA